MEMMVARTWMVAATGKCRGGSDDGKESSLRAQGLFDGKEANTQENKGLCRNAWQRVFCSMGLQSFKETIKMSVNSYRHTHTHTLDLKYKKKITKLQVINV